MRDRWVRYCFVLELHGITEALAFGDFDVTLVRAVMFRRRGYVTSID